MDAIKAHHMLVRSIKKMREAGVPKKKIEKASKKAKEIKDKYLRKMTNKRISAKQQMAVGIIKNQRMTSRNNNPQRRAVI